MRASRGRPKVEAGGGTLPDQCVRPVSEFSRSSRRASARSIMACSASAKFMYLLLTLGACGEGFVSAACRSGADAAGKRDSGRYMIVLLRGPGSNRERHA